MWESGRKNITTEYEKAAEFIMFSLMNFQKLKKNIYYLSVSYQPFLEDVQEYHSVDSGQLR